MKVAIYGVWHVHASQYTKTALQMGQVVGFYERDDVLAVAFAKRFDLPRFESPEALLASDAEGVIVCSASSDHAGDIIRCAKAKKHIFTEKVLALTTPECNAIEAAVKENGVTFCISLFQKYIGSRIAVKNVAMSGELGKINYLRFRNCHSGSVEDWLPKHFYNKEQCGGGAMIDLGAHGMYLAEWILGVPKTAKSVFTVSCFSDAMKEKNIDGLEDNAVTVMGYENGAIAINETGFVSRCSPEVLEVFGEDGYVRMEDHTVIKCTKATEYRPVTVDVPESLPSPLEQFLSSDILGGCGMEQAKALTYMMELAYQ